MIKLYSITQNKTGILGFWKDNTGKIFIDRIKIKSFNAWPRQEINKSLARGEIGIFLTWNNKAFIIYDHDKKTILNHCITWQEKRLKTSFIKLLLNQHNGLTIFKEKNGYKIELWKE